MGDWQQARQLRPVDGQMRGHWTPKLLGLGEWINRSRRGESVWRILNCGSESKRKCSEWQIREWTSWTYLRATKEVGLIWRAANDQYSAYSRQRSSTLGKANHYERLTRMLLTKISREVAALVQEMRRNHRFTYNSLYGLGRTGGKAARSETVDYAGTPSLQSVIKFPSHSEDTLVQNLLNLQWLIRTFFNSGFSS